MVVSLQTPRRHHRRHGRVCCSRCVSIRFGAPLIDVCQGSSSPRMSAVVNPVDLSMAGGVLSYSASRRRFCDDRSCWEIDRGRGEGPIVCGCPVRGGPGNGAVFRTPICIPCSAMLAVSACTPWSGRRPERPRGTAASRHRCKVAAVPRYRRYRMKVTPWYRLRPE